MKTAHNAIPKDILLKDILNVYNKKPSDIKFTVAYYVDNGKFSKSPIKKFGGWNSILQELGIKINVNYDVSKEDIIEDFLRVKKEYDTISSSVYRKHGKYSQILIDKLFGNYSNLLREIEITPMRNVRTLTDEELLSELKKMYEEHGYLNTGLIKAKASFTYQTVLNRFGLMSKVYELLDINCNVNKNMYFNRASEAIEILSNILNERPIVEWTCPLLKNPEKTCHLYIDAYFPIANIAIEYDGIQHDQYVEFLHKSKEKFKRTQMLDKHKESILNQMGIRLIRIKYNEPLNKEYLSKKLN